MSLSRTSLLVRRVVIAKSNRTYHASIQQGGAHYPPPVPPFARSTRRAAPLTENSDAVWDDGVAPELALDFDCPNVSSREALYTWLGAFSLFYVLYLSISAWTNGAKDDNPALSHATDCVDKDYSDNAATPLK